MENGPIEGNAHLVIAVDVLQSQTKLNNLAETVKFGGFVIVCESNDKFQTNIARSDLVLISQLSDENKIYYLLRKVNKLILK